jgi:hypothetical protein
MNAMLKSILIAGCIATFLGCGTDHKDSEEMSNYASAPRSGAQSAPQAAEASEGEGGSPSVAMDTAAAPTSFVSPDQSSQGAPAVIPVSSSAAVVTTRDSTRKFLRTASLRFRAKDAIRTTYAIEDIVSRFGGFVANTQLNSNIDRQTTIAVSEDSSLETTYYTIANSMTLRVPNTKLDSTLKAIAPLVDFLDYRTVSADDIALTMLANELTQRRIGQHEQRLKNAIDNRGRKLEETTTAEENVLNRAEQVDNAKLSNLSLLDQVAYSTINLSIYQRQSFRREIIPNDSNIKEYEPGLGTRLIDGLEIGWAAFAAVIVFLAKFWALIVVLVILFLLYRRFGYRARE